MNKTDDEVFYNEVKENSKNEDACSLAKEKELSNFDEYEVYEEVKEEGQTVLGTRFVLTEKEDGSIKARFVVKGFQEDVISSDSPTASRETLKVFFCITSNQRWVLEGSDVRSAFLQSDLLSRDIFVEPPPQKKKMDTSGSLESRHMG